MSKLWPLSFTVEFCTVLSCLSTLTSSCQQALLCLIERANSGGVGWMRKTSVEICFQIVTRHAISQHHIRGDDIKSNHSFQTAHAFEDGSTFASSAISTFDIQVD